MTPFEQIIFTVLGGGIILCMLGAGLLMIALAVVTWLAGDKSVRTDTPLDMFR